MTYWFIQTGVVFLTFTFSLFFTSILCFLVLKTNLLVPIYDKSHLDLKIFWISLTSLWNSTIVTILLGEIFLYIVVLLFGSNWFVGLDLTEHTFTTDLAQFSNHCFDDYWNATRQCKIWKWHLKSYGWLSTFSCYWNYTLLVYWLFISVLTAMESLSGAGEIQQVSTFQWAY